MLFTRSRPVQKLMAGGQYQIFLPGGETLKGKDKKEEEERENGKTFGCPSLLLISMF